MGFYKFQNNNQNKNSNDDVVELHIEGEILDSKSWWEDYMEEEYGIRSTGAKQFNEELEKYKDKNTVRVLINSPGGDVFAATSIFNMLKRSKKNIEVEITGYCCSSATIIMMAGDKISMPINSLVMIHDPLLGLNGFYNEQDLEEKKAVLARVKNIIVNTYKTRASIDDKQLRKFMSKESWFEAPECLEYGFIDEILYHKQVETVKNQNSIVINNISYNNEKINSFLNKNVQTFKNLLENQPKNIKKEGEFELNQEEILKNERERIQNIMQYKDKIDESLINKAIEDGWDEKDLTFNAFKENKILTNNVFIDHLNANKQQGINEIEPAISTNIIEPTEPKNENDMFSYMGIQNFLDTLNGVEVIGGVENGK